MGEHGERAELRLEGVFALSTAATTDSVGDATVALQPQEHLCSFHGLFTPRQRAPRVGVDRVRAGVGKGQRATKTGGLTRMRRKAREAQKVRNFYDYKLDLRT